MISANGAIIGLYSGCYLFQTPNPKLHVLNPKPQIRNAETPNPKSQHTYIHTKVYYILQEIVRNQKNNKFVYFFEICMNIFFL